MDNCSEQMDCDTNMDSSGLASPEAGEKEDEARHQQPAEYMHGHDTDMLDASKDDMQPNMHRLAPGVQALLEEYD